MRFGIGDSHDLSALYMRLLKGESGIANPICHGTLVGLVAHCRLEERAG